MAYVPVPKDLTKVKTKVALNLTKRQLIFFSLAAVVGIPFYLFMRKPIGSSTVSYTHLDGKAWYPDEYRQPEPGNQSRQPPDEVHPAAYPQPQRLDCRAGDVYKRQLEYRRTGSTRRYHPGYECKWATNTVVHILENREYTGCLVNFKTQKPSYKVKHLSLIHISGTKSRYSTA